MTAPARTVRSARAGDVVAAARALLEQEGRDALTMRRLADQLGIQAPSIYKHFPDKASLELALIEDALVEIGDALHAAVARGGSAKSTVERLLTAYREHSIANPNMYRLATTGPLPGDELPPGLEDWAGEPFLLATGEPYRAQALWSFAHGMVILEIDGRYPEGSDLARPWRAGAAAFTGSLRPSPPAAPTSRPTDRRRAAQPTR